jgi:hypothetical protein
VLVLFTQNSSFSVLFFSLLLNILKIYQQKFTDPETRVRFPALPEKKVVVLERGPLSLVSTAEELLDRKVAAPV